MNLNPLRLPENYVRLPVRMHPEYHRYLKLNALQANLDMADLVRVLIHLAPQNREFLNWLAPRIEKHGSDIVVVRDWRFGDWGPLK